MEKTVTITESQFNYINENKTNKKKRFLKRINKELKKQIQETLGKMFEKAKNLYLKGESFLRIIEVSFAWKCESFKELNDTLKSIGWYFPTKEIITPSKDDLALDVVFYFENDNKDNLEIYYDFYENNAYQICCNWRPNNFEK